MKRLLILILLIPHLVSAQEGQVLRLTQEAEAYFENGQFRRAAESYEALLDKELTPQQRALASYNLGTALLHMGQAKKALDTFESIDLEGDAPPLVRLRTFANSATALLRYILSIEKQWDPNNESYAAEGSKMLELADKGLNTVEKALAAEVDLALREGRAVERDPLRLSRTRRSGSL